MVTLLPDEGNSSAFVYSASLMEEMWLSEKFPSPTQALNVLAPMHSQIIPISGGKRTGPTKLDFDQSPRRAKT